MGTDMMKPKGYRRELALDVPKPTLEGQIEYLQEIRQGQADFIGELQVALQRITKCATHACGIAQKALEAFGPITGEE